MNRLDRLSSILILLQSRKQITASQIADRFEISVRTVYRDIRSLEEAGVPIGAEAGIGYYLMEGYSLPPVLFTKEEAAAMVIGSKLVAEKTDFSVVQHFEQAMDKIKAVLKSGEQDLFESLENQIKVLGPKIPKTSPDRFIIDIQKALAAHVKVNIDYHANYSDATSQRTIAPLSLCFYANKWHLIAFCYLRDAIRDFRTDRIQNLTFTSSTYEPDTFKNMEKEVEHLLVGSEVEEVEIEMSKIAARYISEQKYYYGFIKEEILEQKVIMTFITDNVNYFAQWLLHFGKQARILAPEKLKIAMHKRVQELNEHYGLKASPPQETTVQV